MKNLLITYFFLVQIMLIIWLFGTIMKDISTNEDVTWFFIAFEYFGVCFFSVAFCIFAHYYRFKRVISAKLESLLILITAINYIGVLTNPFHHLFFIEVSPIQNIYGPWFKVHIVYSYSLLLFAFIMLAHAILTQKMKALKKGLVVLGIISPLLMNVIHILGIYDATTDFTPITFNMMLLIAGYIAYRNNYFDINKITRATIFRNMHEGVIVLDRDERIIEYNKIIEDGMMGEINIWKYTKIDDFMHKIHQYIINYEEVKTLYQVFRASGKTSDTIEMVFEYAGKRQYYLLKMQHVNSHSASKIAIIFRYINITNTKELLMELEEKNALLAEIYNKISDNIVVKKRLAIEQERHRVSKEVHDIMGHSVTVVISLLEAVKMNLANNPIIAREKMSQSIEITRNGIKELKRSISGKVGNWIETSKLIEDLEKLIYEFQSSGVHVDFITHNAGDKLQTQVYETIYRCCQEGLTNALRHGNASNVTIAIRFAEEVIDLIIANNGDGCKELVYGNGLSGMLARVQDVEGTFSCGSPEGEGFSIHIVLPILRKK